MIKILFVMYVLVVVRGQRETSKDKYNFLLDRTMSSSYGLVELDDIEAKNYVLDHPRNYDLVILFTAQACKLCKPIEKGFKKVAKAYKKNSMYLPRKFKDSEVIKKPVFFMQIELSFEDRHLVDHYQMTTLPCAFLSLSNEIYISDPYDRRKYMDKHFWRITSSDGVVNANILLNWVTRLTGNDKIEIKTPFYVFVVVSLFLIIFFSFLVFIYIFAESVVLNQKLWLLGALIVFILCAGGSYYSINHKMPFIGFENNEIEFVLKGTRAQYKIEGPLMMALFTIVCFTLVGIRRLLNHNSNMFTRFVICIFLFFLCMNTVNWVELMFASKNFYSPSFFPPNYYIRGGLVKDHGTIQ